MENIEEKNEMAKKFTWIVLSANKMGRDSMLAMEWRKVIERPKYMRLCLNIHLSDIRPFFAIGLNYDKYDERYQSLNIARTGYCIWCHMCKKVSVSVALSLFPCMCAWIWFRFENTKRNTCIDQIIKCNTTGNGALVFFCSVLCYTFFLLITFLFLYFKMNKKACPVTRIRLPCKEWERKLCC